MQPTDNLQAHLARVYEAASPQQLEEAYDRWAASYDHDMENDLVWGGPTECANALAGRAPSDARILDVGAGTGMVGAALREVGFTHIEAADLSERMLDRARQRGIYQALHRVHADRALPFDDGSFGAAIAVGVLTQGHAPPDALRDWVRVVRSGGFIAFTLRPDLADSLGYREMFETLEAEQRWTPVFESADLTGFVRLQSKPYRVYVFGIP